MVWLTTCRSHKGEVLSCWSPRISRVRLCMYGQLGELESWPFQEEDSTQIVKVSVPTVCVFRDFRQFRIGFKRVIFRVRTVPPVDPKRTTHRRGRQFLLTYVWNTNAAHLPLMRRLFRSPGCRRIPACTPGVASGAPTTGTLPPTEGRAVFPIGVLRVSSNMVAGAPMQVQQSDAPFGSIVHATCIARPCFSHHRLAMCWSRWTSWAYVCTGYCCVLATSHRYSFDVAGLQSGHPRYRPAYVKPRHGLQQGGCWAMPRSARSAERTSRVPDEDRILLGAGISGVIAVCASEPKN